MIATEKIIEFYRQRVKPHLDSHEISDWGSAEEQALRFQVLADVLRQANLASPFTVLDVGCGLGDLYETLKGQFTSFSYCGVDLTFEVLQEAKRRKPWLNLVNADVFKASPFHERAFDVVYSSGVFNLDVGNNLEWVKEAIPTLYSLSEKGCMINFLHQRCTQKYEQCFYYDPDEIATYAAQVCNRIEIVDDYLEKDFSLWMRRN